MTSSETRNTAAICRVLVTGASGFLGRALVTKLVALECYEVLAGTPSPAHA